MISRKKQIQVAKAMLKNSLKNNLVDSKSIREVLRKIISQKPPGLTQILKVYRRLIENAIKKEGILIETPQRLTNQKQLEQELIKKTGAKRVNFITNSKIIFGAKITSGDWIYDATLGTKLEQLTVNKK